MRNHAKVPDLKEERPTSRMIARELSGLATIKYYPALLILFFIGQPY